MSQLRYTHERVVHASNTGYRVSFGVVGVGFTATFQRRGIATTNHVSNSDIGGSVAVSA